ncbi:MAG: DUF2779 domain-containing protein [Myxococcota bacterium]|nr:DUF2779 domain-containing protein [Myxococcota bacterium]
MLAALRCKRQAWEMGGVPANAVGIEHQVRRRSRRRLVTAALQAVAPNAEHHLRIRTPAVTLQIDGLMDGRTLIAVQPGATLRRHHLERVALQWWALRGAQVPIDGCMLIHLNSAHRAPGPEPLFLTQDITSTVETAVARLGPRFAAMQDHSADKPPDPEPGTHCTRPRPCAQLEACQGEPTEHSLSDLYRVKDRVLKRLQSGGITRISDIPSDFPLPPIADRQRRAVQSGSLVVDPGIAAALGGIVSPTSFIDFEAVQPAIPLWAGCRPFEAIPVQVSVHQMDAEGAVHHLEWLASGSGDPRPELAAFLAPIVRETGSFVAYFSQFEQNMLTMLADSACEADRDALLASTTRFVDLLPVVREHLYHPDFHGRFNLKTVVGALLPKLAYDDLVVNRGDLASLLLEQFLVDDASQSTGSQDPRRKDLLAYCKRDTLALVELARLLWTLAPEHRETE